MITGTYKLAGTVIRVDSLHPSVHTLCREYASEETPDFGVTVTPGDIRAEAERSARQDMPEDYLETMAVYRKIAEAMPSFDTLLFHGSAICLDGEGYLFTARSGTGKSTHTRLWREVFGDRAFMVNDDKPLLKVTAGGVLVCGTPWDGKHHLSTNTTVPLKAVCMLHRGKENEIHPVSPAEALPALLEQCYRPERTEAFLRTLTLLNTLSGTVAFYRMHCNMSAEAAAVAHAAMSAPHEPAVRKPDRVSDQSR